MTLLQYIIPIITPVGGGEIPPNAMLAIYIAINIFLVIGFFILLVTYFFSDERKYCSPLSYIRNSFSGKMMVIFYVIINGLALLMALADYIMNRLS